MDRLAELREKRALTLRELSEMSGVAADTINQIELGHRKPRPSTLRKLARALDVDVEEFYMEPALPLADAPDTGPSLLDKALDAAHHDAKKSAQAVNRLLASEGTLRNTNISDFEEDKFRAELRALGFPDEHFEGFVWPLIVKALQADQLEQELARREELERKPTQARGAGEQVAEQAQDTAEQVAEQTHSTPVRNTDS
jgi:transcriptional regulator with XRE-family HTH domain